MSRVAFAGQTVGTTTGSDGRWSVLLSPLAPNPVGADLVVTGATAATAHDVVVGEVWLYSGQSNMELHGQRSASAGAFSGPERRDQEVRAANYPLIRQFTVGRTALPEPAAAATGSWAPCSPATVPTFTAVGYFFTFARDLHRRLGVPGRAHRQHLGRNRHRSLARAAGRRRSAHPAGRGRTGGAKRAAAAPAGAARSALDRGPAGHRGPGRSHPAQRAVRRHDRAAPPLFRPQAFSGTRASTVNSCPVWDLRLVFPIPDRELAEAFLDSPNCRSTGCSSRQLLKVPNDPTGRNWAFLREAQAEGIPGLPATGQAVAIDVGDPATVHPRNKQEVGRRLALIAKAKVYGVAVDYSGPVFEKAVREGARLRAMHFRLCGRRADRRSETAAVLRDRRSRPEVSPRRRPHPGRDGRGLLAGGEGAGRRPLCLEP